MQATSEIGAGGVVEMLAVREPVHPAVLLYKGEELVGAKQNRILNVSVLLGAGSTARIPVSCVERGRWSWRDRSFRSAGHVAGPELRRVALYRTGFHLLTRDRQGPVVVADIGHWVLTRGSDPTSPLPSGADRESW